MIQTMNFDENFIQLIPDNYLENNNNNNNDNSDRLKTLVDIVYALDQSAIVAITDRTGKIQYVNDLFCDITGFSREELIGQNHRIINSGYHPRQFFKDMWKTIGTGNIWKGEICNRKKDGSLYWVHASIVPFLNEKGKPYQYISIRTDITKEKLLEKELKKSNEKYQLITENTSDLVSLIDIDGNFHFVSPSFEVLLDTKLAIFNQTKIDDWIHPDDYHHIKNMILSHFETKKDILNLEFRLINSLKQSIDVEANINLVHDQNKYDKKLFLFSIRDIRARKEVERQIYHLAYHDSLTNLPNRRSFMNQLRKELNERALKKSKMAVLFIDLDHFKSVNDCWGHDIGDQVLINASKNILDAIGPNDLVARLGGDEFIVLLRDIKDEESIKLCAERILTNFRSSSEVNGQKHSLTCSIGVALYPNHGNTADELIKNADDSLYTSKVQGRDCYTIFNKHIENQTLERTLLENELRKAIQNFHFYMEYQPKINFMTGELIGMEALVRWNHPDLGKISPGKFIPLAEETGLIVPLGEWILRESCLVTKEWHNNGYDHLMLSVNVSVRQLDDPEFINKVKMILEETKIHPKYLELEITESVIANIQNATLILHELRKLGIKISIDDFGTGYSSLSYIKHLPIDILKVDASFIQDIHQNEESKAIVKAVLTLAKTIGLDVIAEGIEIKEQVEQLLAEGCSFGQGYYFSKPLSKEEFDQFLNSNKIK